MLAPIAHRLPPLGYGPWERVAANLTEGLSAAGHDVTLFAPAGSETSAKLEPTVPYPLDEWPAEQPSPDHRIWEELHIAAMAELVATEEFDVVHSHLGVHALGYARLLRTPMVTTLHGSAWNRSVHPALERHRDLPFVSLSTSERSFYPTLDYVATVHNGIDCDSFVFGKGPGEFLVFAGRMAPEKQPQVAIDVARASGLPLKLAGPVEERHRDFFAAEVRPHLDASIEYLGAVSRAEMIRLYPAAIALLMPLAWDEPFGLVVVESLASGTPVIGWSRGALPELIRDGVTGFLVDDPGGAVAALRGVDQLDRAQCRSDAKSRFSVEAMTRGYVDAYQSVLDRRRSTHLVE